MNCIKAEVAFIYFDCLVFVSLGGMINTHSHTHNDTCSTCTGSNEYMYLDCTDSSNCTYM